MTDTTMSMAKKKKTKTKRQTMVHKKLPTNKDKIKQDQLH
jgi:hypothetical protein